LDFRFRPLNRIKSTFKRLIKGKKEGFGGCRRGNENLVFCEDLECWEEPKRAISDQRRIFQSSKQRRPG